MLFAAGPSQAGPVMEQIARTGVLTAEPAKTPFPTAQEQAG